MIGLKTRLQEEHIIVNELSEIPNFKDAWLFVPAHCFDANDNSLGYEMVIYVGTQTYIIPRKSFGEFNKLFHEMTKQLDPKKTRGYTNCIVKRQLL